MLKEPFVYLAACTLLACGEPGAPGDIEVPVDPMMMMMPSCEQGSDSALGDRFFSDVSEASGIRAGNFVPMPEKPIPINDHSRLGFVDLDGDGYDDIVMHSLYPNPRMGIPFEHLVFLNKRDGTFRDASDESGLRRIQAGFFAFGDVDNDGDVDAFAGLDIPLQGETHRILLNDGKGRFSPKSGAGVETTGPEATTTAGNALFADFDGDGKLDLFVGNGHTSYAAADQLFFGNGDGSFKEVTTTHLTGANPARPTNGLVACDYDDDGDLDVFVSIYGVSLERGHDILWENDGKGKFRDVAFERGFAAQATGNYHLQSTGHGSTKEPGQTPRTYVGGNGFGIDCQDVNGDGHNDIFVTAISHPVEEDYNRKWSDPSLLLINQGPAEAYAFTNEFIKRGLPFNEGDVDGAIVDFDNDGRFEVSVSRDTKYEGRYEGADQKSWFGLMHQLADGSFESVGVRSGINDEALVLKRMKGAQNHAWSDVDHDGDLDLLVGGRDQGGGRPNFLFRNELGSKNTWLAVRLRGDGKVINRDAIGSRVTVKSVGRSVMRELKSSRGTYNSLDTRVLSFGLGGLGAKGCSVSVEVRWPNGKVDQFKDVAVNREVVIDFEKGL